MSSLKGYTPALARHLATTPAALYERQRELVRAGILDPGDGRRGPGSGVRATAPSVAYLLVAALCTDSLSETAEATRAFAAAESINDHPFTGAKTLVDSLAAILLSQAWSRRIVDIAVVRTHGIATIKYRLDGRTKTAEFKISDQARKASLRIEATIGGDDIRAIAKDVYAIVEGSS